MNTIVITLFIFLGIYSKSNLLSVGVLSAMPVVFTLLIILLVNIGSLYWKGRGQIKMETYVPTPI